MHKAFHFFKTGHRFRPGRPARGIMNDHRFCAVCNSPVLEKSYWRFGKPRAPRKTVK